MLKTGITDLKNIKKDKTFFRQSLKNVSITLYPDSFNQNDEDVSERVLLTFADERGAYKRTYSKRFEIFDEEVIKEIIKRHNSSKQLYVHDVAVSDGRTALDFFNQLQSAFSNLKFVASDYDPFVYIVQDKKCKIALSSSGNLLEITYPPFVFNKMKRDSYKHYPINHLVRYLLEKFLVKSMLAKYLRGELLPLKVETFSRKVIKTAKKYSNFLLEKHNILGTFNTKHDVIRAMNVLNASYFSADEFLQILKNIHSALDEGGLFITGSNQDADTMVNGAIYEKRANIFYKIWQSGNGPEIDKVILDFTQI